MTKAFKEWATVGDALERGEQILILRKGGLEEGRGGFRLAAERFWLFPTFYHQQDAGVLPAAAARWAELSAAAPPAEQVRLSAFAEVVASKKLESQEALAGLRGHHVWLDEVLVERFHWGKKPGLFALAVRVWRIPPWETPMRPEYGGCKSWIELGVEPPEEGAAPALDDSAFARRLSALTSAWEGLP